MSTVVTLLFVINLAACEDTKKENEQKKIEADYNALANKMKNPQPYIPK